MIEPAPSGGGASPTLIFDATVTGAPAASLDTGPIIPAGFVAIEALIICRSTYATAVTTGGVGIRCNGDAGNNYTFEGVQDSGGVYAGATNNTVPESTWRTNVPGTTIADANVPAICRYWIPFYDTTLFYKTALLNSGMTDPASGVNCRSRQAHCQWLSLAAINQLTLVAQAGGGALGIGTRMVVAGIRA